jgi:hypothetical protein
VLNILDITGDDIAQLDDDDLRDLIGLLCEEDYRSQGFPTHGITWGGHQDAPDGGVDVNVHDEPPFDSFIQRKRTIFQVKKHKMPPAKIKKEMHFNGCLLDSIQSVLDAQGAYVIVSAKDSTSDKALQNRRQAMKEAVQDLAGHENLYLDFMDCNRVATWVRKYPSLILWVRNRINRPLDGWRPYENWANPSEASNSEYILDEKSRLTYSKNQKSLTVPMGEGIQYLRDELSTKGKSVRLIGLSGTGKTRLVQALFDERIGQRELDKSQVVYTDLSTASDPDPETMARQLVNSTSAVALIIDNCPSGLHNILERVCHNGNVNLLTIEYDIRDDEPEKASVVRLESASYDLIEEMIKRRFPDVSHVDARTIAEFADGNARIAIALANTVERHDSLAGLRQEELFERLFQQRHVPNQDLITSAEVLSLVYSFDGESTEEDSELARIASLAGKSVNDIYRDVSELKRRGLVQARSFWRAVLPQAIANRLAKRALESVPKNALLQAFSADPRLLKSFARRIGYLHETAEAVEIANEWLAEDGFIGKNIGNLTQDGMSILRSIASASPEKVLEAIERVSSQDETFFSRTTNKHCSQFVRLLWKLSYDPELFTRSVQLICRFALTEREDENFDSTRQVLKSIFQMRLSGTHASVELKALVVQSLLDSSDANEQKLGLVLLEAALEAVHFRAAYGDFDFGSRSRDFGYTPQSWEDVHNWYTPFLDICTNLGLSNTDASQEARDILAGKFRGLWTHTGMFDVLEEKAKALHEQKVWNEGWLAIRSVMQYDSDELYQESLDRLQVLEEYLKPCDLLQKARAYVKTFLLEDIETRIYETGRLVAQDNEVLNTLLPEFLSSTQEGTWLVNFGRGLADGYDNKQELWQRIRAELENIPHGTKNFGLVVGFLISCGKTDMELYNIILDEAVDDDVLGECFPYLEITSPIDQKGIERLHRALDLGKAGAYMFAPLANGRNHESIPDDDLAELLTKIAAKEHGLVIALNILGMRFLEDNSSNKHSQRILELSHSLLSEYSFLGNRRGYDYLGINRIVNVCLVGDESVNTAEQMCQHLAEVVKDDRRNIDIYFNTLEIVAERYPIILLDVFVSPIELEDQLSLFKLNGMDREFSYLLNKVPIDKLIEWCNEDPEKRYPLILSIVNPLHGIARKQRVSWKGEEETDLICNPILHTVLENVPDLQMALDKIGRSAYSGIFTGTHSKALQHRAVIFESFLEHENEDVRKWAVKQLALLNKRIESAIEDEQHQKQNQEGYESFE